MSLRNFCVPMLLVSFLVVQGCGPGGGDQVEGIYTGPTAPAALTGEDMESLDSQAYVAVEIATLPFLLSLITLIESGAAFSGISAKPESLPAGSAALVVDENEEHIDTVYTLEPEGGSGSVHIVGVVLIRLESFEPEESRSTMRFDLTFEFQDAVGLYGPETSINGTTRLVISEVDVTTLGGSRSEMGFRSEAAGLRLENISGTGGPEQIFVNGTFESTQGRSVDVDGAAAWSTAMVDEVLRQDPSGEQLRLVGSWSSRGDETNMTRADFRGTLFSTVLGGAVRFTSGSTFDPEGDGLVLTTLGSWDGGAIRLRGSDFETSPIFDAEWDLDGDGIFETAGLSSGGIEEVISLGLNGFF